jgi:hypothetical protein
MELGVGGGSILKWLGSQINSDGKVIGVDKDTKFVGEFSKMPYELFQGDFLEISTPTNLDLVHCRYVLIHNTNILAILQKVYDSLKSGGYLLVEEPDFSSSNLIANILPLSSVKTNDANCKMFSDMGLDPCCGLSLLQKLQKIGFSIVILDSALHYCSGKSPRAEMTAQSIELLKSKLVATGLATETDVDTYIEKARDKDHWAIYGSTISILAKKIGS